MKNIIKVLTVMLVVLGITACGATNKVAPNSAETTISTETTVENSAFPMTILDSYDREVKTGKNAEQS